VALNGGYYMARSAPISRLSRTVTDSEGVAQGADLREMHREEVVEIGYQFAAGNETKIELVEVAVHGDVEPHSVGDDGERHIILKLRTTHP